VSKKEYLLSEGYLLAVQERVGKPLVESQQLKNVERLAFGREGSPSKIDLLQAALAVFCLALREREKLKDTGNWIQEFQCKLKTCLPSRPSSGSFSSKLTHSREQPRLSFWAVLFGNRQLFSSNDALDTPDSIYAETVVGIRRLFDLESVLHHVLESNCTLSLYDLDIVLLLEKWPIETQEGITSLPALFTSRWRQLRESRGGSYEQNIEQQRANWALICAETIRLMDGTSSTCPSVDDVVDLIDAFQPPHLGRNKHDK